MVTETLCTSGAVKYRSGANASTTVTNSGAAMTQFITEAEGDLIADTRCNWVSFWPTISGAAYSQTIEGAVAAKAAIKVINYDPDAIGASTAGLMVNILWSEYNGAVKVLSDSKIISAFGGTLMT